MDGYSWIKALHVISIIAWMSGIFYLPRLFIYRCMQKDGSDAAKTLELMALKLIKIIMTPAMISSWLFGLTLAIFYIDWSETWFLVKFLMVTAMTIYHFTSVKWHREIVAGNNQHSERFYRMANEVPTVLMMIIVIMVIVKPF